MRSLNNFDQAAKYVVSTLKALYDEKAGLEIEIGKLGASKQMLAKSNKESSVKLLEAGKKLATIEGKIGKIKEDFDDDIQKKTQDLDKYKEAVDKYAKDKKIEVKKKLQELEIKENEINDESDLLEIATTKIDERKLVLNDQSTSIRELEVRQEQRGKDLKLRLEVVEGLEYKHRKEDVRRKNRYAEYEKKEEEAVELIKESKEKEDFIIDKTQELKTATEALKIQKKNIDDRTTLLQKVSERQAKKEIWLDDREKTLKSKVKL